MMMRSKEKIKSSSENAEQRTNQETRWIGVTSLRAMDGAGNERKFILSFSSEEPYDRWWGTEVLDHDVSAVDLTRLNTIGCLLYNHNRDKVIGRIIRAWIENNRGYAEIEFDSDDESEVIYQKVKSGTLKGVSVGYQVDAWEEVMPNKTSADGRFTGPVEIARKWSPYEISIVSVPADPTVGVGRKMESQKEKTATSEEQRSLDYFSRQLQINKNTL